MRSRDLRRGHPESAKADANRKRPNWLEVAGLLIGIATAGAAIFALTQGSDAHDRGAARLVLDDLIVRDVRSGPGPHPGFEVIVHNRGNRAAVIDRADLVVRHVYALQRCASQDDLPLSETYGLVLPAGARAGDRVSTHLHDQAGADEADRFKISLSVDVPSDERGTYFLFEVGLSLHDDARRSSLPVGAALVSLPFVPNEGEYYWSKQTASLLRNFETGEVTTRELFGASMPCWRSNTMVLRKALASTATRSKRLDAIARSLVTPSFSKLE